LNPPMLLLPHDCLAVSSSSSHRDETIRIFNFKNGKLLKEFSQGRIKSNEQLLQIFIASGLLELTENLQQRQEPGSFSLNLKYGSKTTY